MDKIRQYRLLKKVEKMLNAPVKAEEVYAPGAQMYVGDSRPRNQGLGSNPNHMLRQTQVSDIAKMLLQQIDRIARLRVAISDRRVVGRDACADIQEGFVGVEIAFEELDMAMVFTDAEREARMRQKAEARNRVDSDEENGDGMIDLTPLTTQIQVWQQEQSQRRRKLYRIDTTVRDLGVNINDVRCSKLSLERRTSVAALDTTIDQGARLLRDVFRKVSAAYRGIKQGI